MARQTLWLRWSLRDLRRRWLSVTAISLVIALGTGTYAALMSTGVWRTVSNDASFALLDTHDLRVRLNEGTTVSEGRLTEIVASLPSNHSVSGQRERLVVPTQVAGPHGLLAPGELVGAASTGRPIDGVFVHSGRGWLPSEDGRPVAVVEQSFAVGNALPTAGRLTLSGGVPVRYVGLGQSPEYFLVSGGEGSLPFLGDQSYAVLFTTLHSAQRLTGAPSQVNDIVLALEPGSDTARLADELDTALAAARPRISATVTSRDDMDSFRILYDDIDGDRQLWRVIAMLVLLGAAFAAFNLTSRIVEAQRHEIGIGMALGVPSRLLALRPLLFGAQVALIGVVVGVGVGWLLGLQLRAVFTDMLPLPVWRTDFQVDLFVEAAALGFLLPFAAVAWPVWRALRVEPVEAIRVGHLAARGRGRARLRRRLPVPGPSYRQIPLRNVTRTPRRTALTVFGIGAAITTSVTMLGIFDSFGATLDRSENEILRTAPHRVTASLRALESSTDGTASRVAELPAIGSVGAGLLIPVTASTSDGSLDLITEVISADAAWEPSIREGRSRGGLVLSSKAVADLGVQVGDTITLEHPAVVGRVIQTVETEVPVAGVHPSPMRMLAYADRSSAWFLGLDGMTNLLTIEPAPGYTEMQVRRALLAVPTVGAVQSASTTVDSLESTLDQFLGILQVTVGVTLVLALLIAFNSTSIGVDERCREHATMLAFGLPVRTVVGLTALETLIIGLFGTLLGVIAGYGVTSWVVRVTLASTLPEIEVDPSLAGSTLLLAVALGIGASVGAAVLTTRRISGMDVPSALRVVE